jgi:hypothetical protein
MKCFDAYMQKIAFPLIIKEVHFSLIADINFIYLSIDVKFKILENIEL